LILYGPAAALSAPMTGQRWRGSPRAGATAVAAPAEVPRVETDLLTPRAAHELVRNRKVAAVAPVMPMTLVRPLKTQSASAGEAETPPWGLHAVGALSSPFDGAGIVVALLDTGIEPIERIQMLCGHASKTTTERYIKARWRETAQPNTREIGR